MSIRRTRWWLGPYWWRRSRWPAAVVRSTTTRRQRPAATPRHRHRRPAAPAAHRSTSKAPGPVLRPSKAVSRRPRCRLTCPTSAPSSTPATISRASAQRGRCRAQGVGRRRAGRWLRRQRRSQQRRQRLGRQADAAGASGQVQQRASTRCAPGRRHRAAAGKCPPRTSPSRSSTWTPGCQRSRPSVDSGRALLAQAQTIGEITSLEAELSRREADLASLQARSASSTTSPRCPRSRCCCSRRRRRSTSRPSRPRGLPGRADGRLVAFLTSLQVLLTIWARCCPGSPR